MGIEKGPFRCRRSWVAGVDSSGREFNAKAPSRKGAKRIRFVSLRLCVFALISELRVAGFDAYGVIESQDEARVSELVAQIPHLLGVLVSLLEQRLRRKGTKQAKVARRRLVHTR